VSENDVEELRHLVDAGGAKDALRRVTPPPLAATLPVGDRVRGLGRIPRLAEVIGHKAQEMADKLRRRKSTHSTTPEALIKQPQPAASS